MRAAGLILALGLSGCVILAVPVVAPPPPLSWRLVDEEREEGRLLILEPDVRPWRIEVRLTRERAQTGEIVEAEIRLTGADGRHRIELSPDRPEVSILGPREVEVEGDRPVRVRFTCRSVGRGGLRVAVKD